MSRLVKPRFDSWSIYVLFCCLLVVLCGFYPTVPFLKTIIMGASKKFKDIEVLLVDAVELRDKLDDTIAEIKMLQPNTDVKVSGKITLQYYVEKEDTSI